MLDSITRGRTENRNQAMEILLSMPGIGFVAISEADLMDYKLCVVGTAPVTKQ